MNIHFIFACHFGFMMAKLSRSKKKKKRARKGKMLKDRVLDARELSRRRQTGSKH